MLEKDGAVLYVKFPEMVCYILRRRADCQQLAPDPVDHDRANRWDDKVSCRYPLQAHPIVRTPSVVMERSQDAQSKPFELTSTVQGETLSSVRFETAPIPIPKHPVVRVDHKWPHPSSQLLRQLHQNFSWLSSF